MYPINTFFSILSSEIEEKKTINSSIDITIGIGIGINIDDKINLIYQ